MQIKKPGEYECIISKKDIKMPKRVKAMNL